MSIAWTILRKMSIIIGGLAFCCGARAWHPLSSFLGRKFSVGSGKLQSLCRLHIEDSLEKKRCQLL